MEYSACQKLHSAMTLSCRRTLTATRSVQQSFRDTHNLTLQHSCPDTQAWVSKIHLCPACQHMERLHCFCSDNIHSSCQHLILPKPCFLFSATKGETKDTVLTFCTLLQWRHGVILTFTTKTRTPSSALIDNLPHFLACNKHLVILHTHVNQIMQLNKWDGKPREIIWFCNPWRTHSLEITPVQNYKHLIVGNTATRESAFVNTFVMLWLFHQGNSPTKKKKVFGKVLLLIKLMT